MGLTGNDIVMIIIETADTGVVPQYRDNPVFLIFECKSRRLYTGIKEVVRDLGFSRGKVAVSEQSLEGVMVAVITSALGNIFQFYIGWIRQTHASPFRPNGLIEEIGSYRRYVVRIQCQVSGIANRL